MSPKNPPQYDFSHPVFRAKRTYLLYAREHLEMWELLQKTDVIDWEVHSTVSSLRIPTVYRVHYKIRSIVGIDADRQPIYSDHHTMELRIPTRYPLEPAVIFMITDVWHPNIKSEGNYKGRICGNVGDFGVEYTLPQLVLRVGEILQYKNYLAEFVPPYPEDEKVAQWVRNEAEPAGIVNRKKGIFVDDTPLIQLPEKRRKIGGDDTPSSDADQGPNPAPPPEPEPDSDKPASGPSTSPKITIKATRKPPESTTKRRIVIKGKPSDDSKQA